MASEAAPKEYPLCFGCGQANPIGLRLDLQADGEGLTAEFVPREEHQGWPGIVHGGIIASLLYEVLENFTYRRGVVTMMKEMRTRLRRPAPTGSRLVARSWLESREGRAMNVAASLTGEDGELIAEGDAVLVELSQGQKERLGLAPAAADGPPRRNAE